MKQLILISIFSLAISHFSFAQSTVNLYGKVLDARTKEPLFGATVQVIGTNNGAVVDVGGNFILNDVSTGTVSISARYSGYLPFTKTNIVVKSKGNDELLFELKVDVNELEDVVVTPNPFQVQTITPLSIQNLSAEEIQTYPGGNNDIAKVVQSLPGVGGSAGGFRNDIIIRGGAPNENVYYLDGIEIPNINHFSTQGSAGGPIGLLNVDFINDVDLSSSAFNARYDNPLSGVLQFNQRTGNSRKRQSTFRVGASEAAFTTEGPLKGKNGEKAKTTYLISARRSYLQLLFQWLDIPILPDYWDFQYKVNHEIDDRNTIYLTGVGSIDDFAVKAPDDFSALEQADLEQVPIIKQWSTTTGLGWKRRLKEGKGFLNTTLSLNILNNDLARYQDNENEIGLLERNNSQESEYRFRTNYRRFIGDWTVEIGANLTGVDYTNETLSEESNFKSEFSMLRYGVHGQISRDYGRFGFSAGLRFDDNTFSTEKNTFLKTFSPRVSAYYQLDESGIWNLSATVGRYFKIAPYTVLGYKDENGAFANKDVSYTQSTHYTAGINRRLGDFAKISIEGFYKQYDNYLISVQDSVSLANKGGDFSVLGNEDVLDNGKGRSYGLEVLYQQKLHKNIYAIAAYTLFKSEFTDINEVYRPSVWDSRHLFTFTGGYKTCNNWEFSIRNRLTGRTPYAPLDEEATFVSYPLLQLDYNRLGEEKLDVFNQLDIRIDKKWNFEKYALNVYFEAQNVLGQVLPQAPIYGLNRDASGNIIQPNTLVRLPEAAGTVIPTIGLVLDF